MKEEEEKKPLDVVVAELDAELKKLKKVKGWDAPRAFLSPQDRFGAIRVQHLSVQGNIRVSRDDAEAYLAWLRAGNTGSVMAWAKQAGRRLG